MIDVITLMMEATLNYKNQYPKKIPCMDLIVDIVEHEVTPKIKVSRSYKK